MLQCSRTTSIAPVTLWLGEMKGALGGADQHNYPILVVKDKKDAFLP
jgi:hypothetical protein